jgi:D-mannonate dehydratase
MTDDEVSQIKIGLANGVLNQMTLNHILEACKQFSTQVAEQHFEQMSDEDKTTMLEKLSQEGNQENELTPVG